MPLVGVPMVTSASINAMPFDRIAKDESVLHLFFFLEIFHIMFNFAHGFNNLLIV